MSEHRASVISIQNHSGARAVEVEHVWKELHCKLTLRQIAIFTDLVRAVTVRLFEISENDKRYDGVLGHVDALLDKILNRYPNTGGNLKEGASKKSLRIIHTGIVPANDEGIDFVNRVYDLLENRDAELKAEHERAKLELEAELKALLAKPLPPGNLYHLKIRYAPRNKRGRYGRYDVWGKNEAAAEEKALVKFHKEFPIVRAENFPFDIIEIEIQERGSWRWNWYFQHDGGKCE